MRGWRQNGGHVIASHPCAAFHGPCWQASELVPELPRGPFCVIVRAGSESAPKVAARLGEGNPRRIQE
eukprot:15457437-Alexandrium_andersonii.AAC.1